MRLFFILLISGLLFSSCLETSSKKNRFSIDFTFDDMWNRQYSMLIDFDNSVFIAKGLKDRKFYKLNSLNNDTIVLLDTLIKRIVSANRDVSYRQQAADVDAFKMIIRGKEPKSVKIVIDVSGDVPDKNIKDIVGLLNHIVDNSVLIPVDSAIGFESMVKFYPPLIDTQVNNPFTPR